MIDSLTTGRRTAIGAAILELLDAISEVDSSVAPVQPDASPSTDAQPQPQLPRGAYAPAIIVLLTDGASNAGPLPVDAASEAAARGVRVYTIGFGTNDPNSERPPCGIQFLGNEPNDPFGFGGFGGGGAGFRRAIDEQTLMAVADATGGEYYPAASADELQKVFANLPTNLMDEAGDRGSQRAVRSPRGGARRARHPARPGLAAVALTAPARGEDLACLVVDLHRSRSSC